jgi:hypothetical protein
MANPHIPAKNVGAGNTVRMVVSKTSARIAVGSPYVCMATRDIGAKFAMQFVVIPKRRESVRYVVLKSKQSQVSVRMGSKNPDALYASMKGTVGMTDAYITAKIAGVIDIVCMDVSRASARIAVGSPYVRITARNIGASFAVKNVIMEKGGFSVVCALLIASDTYYLL